MIKGGMMIMSYLLTLLQNFIFLLFDENFGFQGFTGVYGKGIGSRAAKEIFQNI